MMGWADLGIIALAVAVFVCGLVGARAVARLLLSERARRQDLWEPRGMVHGSDMVLRVALIVVWAGFAIGSIALLPALAWAFDGDTEARDVAIRIFMVGAVIIIIGIGCSLPGLRLLVIDEQGVTRAGVFTDTELAFTDIERVDEARTVPAIIARGAGQKIRIPRSAAGFDDLFNRLVGSIGSDALHRQTDQATASTPNTSHYAVSNTRLRLNIGFLIASLLFFVLWPWFVVDGEHPIRDSFFFVGVGLPLWFALAFLVSNETLQRGQPIELELHDSTIRWRTLRGPWRERPAVELVSASVEPWIMYVKGQPGRRYPLRLRFIDEEVLEIDDFRGKHLGASSHLIGVDVRRRYLTTANRSSHDHENALAFLNAARQLEADGNPLESIAPYRHAIALWPSPEHLALYGHVGDVLRTHGQTPEHTAIAIAHYRAHVDIHPSDADAWQALGSCLSGGLRNDSAEEAIATAEQLLMSGRHVPPPN